MLTEPGWQAYGCNCIRGHCKLDSAAGLDINELPADWQCVRRQCVCVSQSIALHNQSLVHLGCSTDNGWG